MSDFSAKWQGLDKLRRTIARMRRAVRDLRPLFKIYEGDFYNIQEEHFDEEGGRTKWAPNSPIYAAIKRREYGESRVMHLSGDLRDGLTRMGGVGQMRRVSDRQMILGTSLDYAGTHHKGSTAEMYIPAPFNLWINGVPARPLIGFHPGEDERRWKAIGEEHFRAVWEGFKT